MKCKFFLILMLAVLPLGAKAWDGKTSGTIQSIDVTAGENFGFRLVLKNSPTLCGNSNTWAYINESDSNSKTLISVLLAAKLAEKPVTIFTFRETASGKGYCHILYITLQ